MDFKKKFMREKRHFVIINGQFIRKNFCYSIAKSCPTLCNPMDCSTSGFPVLHHLPEFAQSHARWVRCWCHPTISSSVTLFSSCPQPFPASGSFPMSQFFASGGQIIGVSDSASVLLVDIQDWFPLGLTGLISLQSKGLPRVFSSTTIFTSFKWAVIL